MTSTTYKRSLSRRRARLGSTHGRDRPAQVWRRSPAATDARLRGLDGPSARSPLRGPPLRSGRRVGRRRGSAARGAGRALASPATREAVAAAATSSDARAPAAAGLNTPLFATCSVESPATGAAHAVTGGRAGRLPVRAEAEKCRSQRRDLPDDEDEFVQASSARAHRPQPRPVEPRRRAPCTRGDGLDQELMRSRAGARRRGSTGRGCDDRARRWKACTNSSSSSAQITPASGQLSSGLAARRRSRRLGPPVTARQTCRVSVRPAGREERLFEAAAARRSRVRSLSGSGNGSTELPACRAPPPRPRAALPRRRRHDGRDRSAGRERRSAHARSTSPKSSVRLPAGLSAARLRPVGRDRDVDSEARRGFRKAAPDRSSTHEGRMRSKSSILSWKMCRAADLDSV